MEADLQTYRAYLLDEQGKIRWGDWIEAVDDSDALAKAKQLCREGTPTVEVWQGTKKLGKEGCRTQPIPPTR